MPQYTAHDRDPRDPALLEDQLAAYDAMRRRCPVAHSEYLHWSVFRHADVLQVLHHRGRFSNAVSADASIPNGIDPPEHTKWRALVEPYFAADVLAAFEPRARSRTGRLQLRVVMQAVLSGTRNFRCASAGRRARYPASGFAVLPIRVER